MCRNDSIVGHLMNMKSLFYIFFSLTCTILLLIFGLRKIVIWWLKQNSVENIFLSPSLQFSYWSQYSVITLSPSVLLKWSLGEVEDSVQNTTNSLNVSTESPTKDTTTTTILASPSSDSAVVTTVQETGGDPAVSWDRTLTWDNSLTQLKLLKSVGNGSERFVPQTGLLLYYL